MPEVRGLVVSGEGEGKLTGYPTANLKLEPGSFRPNPGIYMAWVEGVQFVRQPALLVSGVVWETPGIPRIEVYVLDFEGDLYNKNVTIELGQRLRDTQRFTNQEELIKQIETDVATARKLSAPLL